MTEQDQICARFGVEPVASPDEFKVGIARNVRSGIHPVNGLRIRPDADTTGWYNWAGQEWSDDPEFFLPLHVRHLATWAPQVIPFLLLPPGWRFLVAPGHEDVWKDDRLLLDHS